VRYITLLTTDKDDDFSGVIVVCTISQPLALQKISQPSTYNSLKLYNNFEGLKNTDLNRLIYCPSHKVQRKPPEVTDIIIYVFHLSVETRNVFGQKGVT
jgi:hypothetical protein